MHTVATEQTQLQQSKSPSNEWLGYGYSEYNSQNAGAALVSG